MAVKDVQKSRLDPERFQAVLDPDSCGRFLGRLEVAAERLGGRRLWQVNSTEQGGGVAEMVHFLLGYQAGAGIDTRWVVLEGNEEFSAVTKRVHHLLHGQPGDEGELDEPARANYRQTLKETRPTTWPGRHGVSATRRPASRRLCVLPLYLLLGRAGSGSAGGHCPVHRCRRPQESDPGASCGQRHSAHGRDPGGSGRAHGDPGVPASGREPWPGDAAGRDDPGPANSPRGPAGLSRWDRLKDPLGVLQGFSRHVPEALGAQLLLAGPAAASVSDDPEGDQVLQQVRRAGAALPRATRDRVHLACLPMRTWRRTGPWSTPSSAAPT
jgi:trehalose synthase